MTNTMNSKMHKTMTAACTGAAFCCACAAFHTVILSVLGAIIMASIIICALVSITILVSVFVAGISILVLVLLVLEYCDSPRLR